MALVTLGFVIGPMLLDRDRTDGSPDVALYRAQLEEVDRDLARNLLDAEEAELARTEIARRLLAARQLDSGSRASPRGLSRVTAGASLLAMLVVAGLSYLAVGKPGEPDQPLSERLAMAERIRETRPSQAELEAALPPAPPVQAEEDYVQMVDQLRAIMAERPDDPRGWSLLAEHEARLGNFAASARAQQQLIALKGDDATERDRVVLLDLLVRAASGYVSPTAEEVIEALLEINSDNVPARFYFGSLYAQTGRPDIAYRLWRPLVEDAPESMHTEMARAQISDVAEMAGITYRVPDRRGPSPEDIANAQDMDPETRQAMIEGMVAQLADRLGNEGGGPSEWARLISAYGVLGDTESAGAVWAEARNVFATSPDAMEILTEAAASAGVLE